MTRNKLWSQYLLAINAPTKLCVLCHNDPEDIEHMLFTCNATKNTRLPSFTIQKTIPLSQLPHTPTNTHIRQIQYPYFKYPA